MLPQKMGEKGQINIVVSLLLFLAVGVVGGMFVLSFYNSTLINIPQAGLSTNANLVAVQNTYIPLTIAAVAVGTGIATLVIGLSAVGVFGRRGQ